MAGSTMVFADTVRADNIKVFIYGADPLSQAGMVAYLRERPELELVGQADLARADVALVVAQDVDESTLRVVRGLRRESGPRVLVLVAETDTAGAGAAIHAGAVGVLRRCAATREGLLSAVRAAAMGEGVLPPDLLGGLLRQVHDQARGTAGAGRLRPSDREIRVLRLLSEGCDTREIARTLSYSERTVKNVISDVTRRFGLRNRSHAVAFALREGLI